MPVPAITKDHPDYARIRELKETFFRCVEQSGIDDAEGLLGWLGDATDFFEAPASTRFHLSRPGGLCEHSINVLNNLNKIYDAMGPNTQHIRKRSLGIVSLFHDVCKANFYTIEMRNKKIDGKWHSVPFYGIKDDFPYGHGEKSAIIISRFMELTVEEIMAIRWHMGAFDASVSGGDAGMGIIGSVYERWPLALYLHTADQFASYIDEAGTSQVN